MKTPVETPMKNNKENKPGYAHGMLLPTAAGACLETCFPSISRKILTFPRQDQQLEQPNANT
jgi:hypothetical protein